ncbi:hypothetical protein AGMMS50230_20540 [Spirochaetia bacterium]|nr:hypothetical protein AGMMS50230_20540 [Spirochaetia bacterium]
MGNITVSGTKIKLINYSFCPKCNAVFSFKDLAAYYSNPRPDPAFANRTIQFRNDTRVCCHVCNDYFLPALVISDGTPKNEVQFLCRTQTVNAIENYFLERKIQVLTHSKKNIINDSGNTLVLNDIVLEKLKEKPTLISNLIQYTPAGLMFNLIDGSNVEKRDMLFGGWGI